MFSTFLLTSMLLSGQSLEERKSQLTHWMTYLDTPYYAIKSSAENILREEDSIIFRGGVISGTKMQKKFARWDYFWSKRVTADGRFAPFNQGLFALLNHASWPVCTNGGDWHSEGPIVDNLMVGGKIEALAFRKDVNGNIIEIYAGSPTSGLWHSTAVQGQLGTNWDCISDLSANMAYIGIQDIVIDQTNPNIVYVATGTAGLGTGMTMGIGIMRFDHSTRTWTRILEENQPGRVTRKILIHPTNPLIIYAIIGHEVLQTIDGGQNWQTTFSGDINSPFYSGIEIGGNGLIDAEFHPTNPNIVYVSSDGNRGIVAATGTGAWGVEGKVIRTLNNGSTWSEMTLPPFADFPITGQYQLKGQMSIAVSQAAPDRLYILSYGAFIYIDNASSSTPSLPVMIPFSTNGFLFEARWGKNGIVVNDANPDIIYFASGSCFILKSNDLGVTTFYPGNDLCGYGITPNDHTDLRGIKLISSMANGNDIVLVGNDGGIGISYDGGANMQKLNGNNLNGNSPISSNQLYGVGTSSISEDKIFTTGAQDNHVFYKRNANTSSVNGFGDGARAISDWSNPEISYCSNDKWYSRKPTL
jgi:hypothetical protein